MYRMMFVAQIGFAARLSAVADPASGIRCSAVVPPTRRRAEPLLCMANKSEYAWMLRASSTWPANATDDHETIALRSVKQGGAGGARPGAAARRRRALSGNHLPVGAEPRQGHAVQLDAEPVSRLHPRLPLLLRAPLPDAVRARPGRRVLVADLREGRTSPTCCGASSTSRRGRASWSRSARRPIRISRSKGTTS